MASDNKEMSLLIYCTKDKAISQTL